MPEVVLEGKTLVREEGWVGSTPVRGSLFVKLPEAPMACGQSQGVGKEEWMMEMN